MIAYLASPYSQVQDKHALMRIIAKHSGQWMIDNPGWFVVTGLIHHYAALECPELRTDYAFWEAWCVEFLRKCDMMLVLMVDGWETSVGIQSEIVLATELGIPIKYLVVNP